VAAGQKITIRRDRGCRAERARGLSTWSPCPPVGHHRHVVGAQFSWRRGLVRAGRPRRGFYAVLVASIGLVLAVGLAGISVIGMLVAASVIGGPGTPIGLVLLVRLARDSQVMGPQAIARMLAIAGTF
jgi:Mn2+/Fe2+ NRAMP family transporter